jgi:hypothetical protein
VAGGGIPYVGEGADAEPGDVAGVGAGPELEGEEGCVGGGGE